MNGLFDRYDGMFSELARLQQGIEQAFRPGATANIRALSRRAFPAINVGSTVDAIEVMALTPGLEPADLQITVEKGLLVIAGERKDADETTVNRDGAAVYAQERFKGSFRRVISLPDEIEPAKIHANCKDGLLRITVPRREAARPRQIAVN
jgi:HSP20 family protein